jgi:cyclohexyl-isocyanide hydratase
MSIGKTNHTVLKIGSVAFEGMDQIDLTGPFEVLSRIPGATYVIYGQALKPVRDVMGLRIMPDETLENAPQLDVLHVPGGKGQEALMDDSRVHEWLRKQAGGARAVLCVCTGALLLGAAGLLVNKRATTHWASMHLLPYFGAIPVDSRVVVDGKWYFAAGVTAGIDGALTLAAHIAGREAAERIQLDIAYAPEPPFNSGDPETAPEHITREAKMAMSDLTSSREQSARRVAARLGINTATILPTWYEGGVR